MKIGASTLAGIEFELEKTLDFIENLGIEYAELVHQYPAEFIDSEILESYNLKYSIHAPFMDVNIASPQDQSRLNSIAQIKSSIDLANEINAEAVVVHPGLISFLANKYFKKEVYEFANESIKEIGDYAKDLGVMATIVGFSLTLPGASIGLAELFNPDWSLLTHFEIWMAAFGQIVFSLSLGMSIAFTYASYTSDDADLITNTISIALANSLFENFAALGVFSILGYMSLQSGTAVADLVTQGPGLVFVVYPTVFNVLGQWAYVLGPLFFLTVYLAGLTSILSTIEPLSFSIQNKFDLTRSRTMTILVIVGAAMSMIYATAYGGELLGFVDTFLNQIALLLGVVLECIIFAWIFKAEKLINFLNSRSKTIKLGKWWLVIVKYILPIFISIIWIGGIIDVINTGTMEQLNFTVVIALLLLISTGIFTILPSKNPEWDDTEERV